MARGEVVTFQAMPGAVHRGTHSDRQAVHVKPVRVMKGGVFADDVEPLDAVQPILGRDIRFGRHLEGARYVRELAEDGLRTEDVDLVVSGNVTGSTYRVKERCSRRVMSAGVASRAHQDRAGMR